MLNIDLDLILNVWTVVISNQLIMICIELVCEGLRRIYRISWQARNSQGNKTENSVILDQERGKSRCRIKGSYRCYVNKVIVEASTDCWISWIQDKWVA
jgi:hypothetical protein